MGWILAAVLGAALFFYVRPLKAILLTVQDLLGAKASDIRPDGLIRTGTRFRRVIEVQPANLDTVSRAELKHVWVSFCGMVNTVGIPYTLLVQSQQLDMKDYTDDYGRQVEEGGLPEPLRASGRQVQAYLAAGAQETKIRDYRGLVILHYDPVAASVDSGVQTGSGLLDTLIGKAGGGTRMTRREQAEIAAQILEEAAAEVFALCEQAGMRYQLLDRAGVINAGYLTLQRELAPQARMSDAIRAGAFYPVKHSVNDWGEEA